MLNEIETITIKNGKRVKIRKENDGFYYVVNPNTLEILKFNYVGAFILYMKLYKVQNENIICMLSDKANIESKIISKWMIEFELYLYEKEFL